MQQDGLHEIVLQQYQQQLEQNSYKLQQEINNYIKQTGDNSAIYESFACFGNGHKKQFIKDILHSLNQIKANQLSGYGLLRFKNKVFEVQAFCDIK